MERKDFIKQMASSALILKSMDLQAFNKITNELPASDLMPILFTSHGNPMDIPLPLKANPFFTNLFNLGEKLRSKYEIKAILVVSAHWNTNGTFVNVSPKPETLYDYYGFPPEYYGQKYPAPGAPEIAMEVTKLIPSVMPTTDWGLDHGSWPMLKHLFPAANIPVFEMSMDYDKPAQYHYDLAKQLKSLRKKGVLIIGSGAIVHNIPAAIGSMQRGGKQYGWDNEFDHWAVNQLKNREFQNLVDYKKNKLANLAVPTPDHYVPMLYSLGVMNKDENVIVNFEEVLPAFSNTGFTIGMS